MIYTYIIPVTKKNTISKIQIPSDYEYSIPIEAKNIGKAKIKLEYRLIFYKGTLTGLECSLVAPIKYCGIYNTKFLFSSKKR